jgi:opacity protein-like surface antigen
MKRLLFAAALAATSFPALANDVVASISIGQPGSYGQIDIGGYPQPQIIYAQPRVMYRAAMSRPPI